MTTTPTPPLTRADVPGKDLDYVSAAMKRGEVAVIDPRDAALSLIVLPSGHVQMNAQPNIDVVAVLETVIEKYRATSGGDQ